MTPRQNRASTAARTRGTLDRATVAKAAITLIERDGIERLTMRSLATEVDCGTMTLYTHVRNRDDLLAAAIEDLIAELDIPALVRRTHRNWQELLLETHRAYRDIARRFPRSFELLALAPYDLQPVTTHLDSIIASLESLGLDHEQAVTALRVSDSFSTGYLLVHARRADAVADATVHRGAHTSADLDFERGIQIVLQGLAASFGGSPV